MKQFTISIKTSTEALVDFKSALKKARAVKQASHYKISFDNRWDFERASLEISLFYLELRPLRMQQGCSKENR